MRLTAKAIAALSLPEGRADVIHFDDELSGFGYRLRRSPAGKVNTTWIVQYRRGGASRRVLLAAGNVLSADQARGEARKILAMVALGADPQGDKAIRRDRDRLSMRSVVDEFLAAKAETVRVGSLREITRHLTGPYFRALHGMAVDSVTRKDVAAAIVAAQRRHGPNVAGVVRATLSSFFSWAMTMGLTESNPVVGSAQPKRAEARSRVLSDAELGQIWKACGDDDHGRIVRLLILTGCRRQEIGGMVWDELDLDRGIWTIPPARSKNGKAHVLPLLPAMLDIVKTVPRMAERDHLFGLHSPLGFTAWAGGKAALDAHSGVTDWRVHDVRRTVATRLGDIGLAPHIIEQILNHQGGHRAGVAGVYNRSSYEGEVRAALALWADHVRALVEGGARRVLAFAPQAS